MKDDRANGKTLRLDVFDRIRAFGPLCRGLVHNKERGRVSGDLQQIGKLGHRFERKQVWFNRRYDDIGTTGGFGGIGGRMRRRVDDYEIDALNLGLVYGGGKTYRMGWNHPRMFTRASIRPFGGCRLGVNVDHRDFVPLPNGSNSQIKRNGRFADSALFRHNSYYRS